jgi:glucose/mannose-6-phosphate isomerase
MSQSNQGSRPEESSHSTENIRSRTGVSPLDRQAARRVDPGGMLERIGELPDQLDEAWRLTRTFQPSVGERDIDLVLVIGMGGSAIGGDLVRAFVVGEAATPITVSREYDIPAYAGPRTLVVASSYSGNTEETLSAYHQARARGCPIVAISTGGTLSREISDDRSGRSSLLQFAYPQNQQPRAALGYSFGLLLGVVERLGLIADQSPAVDDAIAVMRQVRSECSIDAPEPANQAKMIARSLHGRIPTIYGAGVFAEVAKRWKGQFNENSKSWAASDQLPELNHNAVVGFAQPGDLSETSHVVLLDSNHYHARVRRRLEITAELLDRRGIPYTIIPPTGHSLLAQALSATYLGDFASYFLALLYGEDPTPVAAIDFLKERLAQE